MHNIYYRKFVRFILNLLIMLAFYLINLVCSPEKNKMQELAIPNLLNKFFLISYLHVYSFEICSCKNIIEKIA